MTKDKHTKLNCMFQIMNVHYLEGSCCLAALLNCKYCDVRFLADNHLLCFYDSDSKKVIVCCGECMYKKESVDCLYLPLIFMLYKRDGDDGGHLFDDYRIIGDTYNELNNKYGKMLNKVYGKAFDDESVKQLTFKDFYDMVRVNFYEHTRLPAARKL